jgi:hypothetical protein
MWMPALVESRRVGGGTTVPGPATHTLPSALRVWTFTTSPVSPVSVRTMSGRPPMWRGAAT